MPQYKEGLVVLTQGSNVVTGIGTNFLAYVTDTSLFICDRLGTSIPVQSVDSNTQLTLASNFALTSSPPSGEAYAIFVDVTTRGYPLLSRGDTRPEEAHNVLTRRFDEFDDDLDKRPIVIDDVTQIFGLEPEFDGQRYSLTEYISETSDGGGELVWRANVAKSQHDGGRFFDPDIPYITLSAYLSAVGGVGNGVFERINQDIGPMSYGANAISTDIAPSVQAFIDSATASGLISFAHGSFTAQRILTTAVQLEINKKSIVFDGSNSDLKWGGSAGGSLFHVVDSSRCQFRNMTLLGSITNTPSTAFYFEAPTPAGVAGTNENHVIENIIIGRRYGTDTTGGGSADPTPQFKLDNGIVIGGAVDGNNDEYTIRNVQIHSCTNYGVDFQNSQSIWSQLENVFMNDCDVGLRAGCNLNLINPTFNRNKTHDIIGIRRLSVRITNFQTENAAESIRSDAGASFYITGGKLLRNNVAPANFINVQSGGDLVLRDLQFVNVQPATIDKIRYISGSLAGGVVDVKSCDIPHADDRSMWIIDAGAFGAKATTIDIDVVGFRFKTTLPYLDRELDTASLATNTATTVATGSSPVVVDQFYNVSFAGDLQGQHLSHVITSASNARIHLANLTVGTIDLGLARYRFLGLGDRVDLVVTRNVTPALMANGTGQIFNLPLVGARLGDHVTWAEGVGWNNILVTAYVSQDNVATVKLHNASGGSSLPPPTNLRVGRVRPDGRFIASAQYTPALIANGAGITIPVSVPGARLGGHVFVSYTADLQGLIVTANVSSDDSVTIAISNRTGAGVTLAVGDFNVMVI